MTQKTQKQIDSEQRLMEQHETDIDFAIDLAEQLSALVNKIAIACGEGLPSTFDDLCEEVEQVEASLSGWRI